MRTRLLLCLTVLGLASCTGSLRHSQLDAGKTGAPRTSSDYSLASPRWENWGGSRCLTHNANFGPANFAGIIQSSATISSQECFGAPIVVEESGTDLDQIYLVDKASNLYRFNWPTNTSLVIAGSFPKAPPSPPLDPCKSTPCVSFNGVISYEDDAWPRLHVAVVGDIVVNPVRGLNPAMKNFDKIRQRHRIGQFGEKFNVEFL